MSENFACRLCSICLFFWNIKIIYEVDESFTGWWSEGSSCSLLYIRLYIDLKSFCVRLHIKYYGGVNKFVFIKLGKIILNYGCLTSTSRANIKYTSPTTNMKIKKESLSSNFSSWNNYILEKTFIQFVKRGNYLIPMDPGSFHWVIEEIEALSIIRELNLRHLFP